MDTRYVLRKKCGKDLEEVRGVKPMYTTFKKKTGKNKTGIPESMKSRFEASSGFSFDDVRIHYNSPKPGDMGALAYTRGSQVYIAPGEEKHLPHELGHVVQQKRGIVPATVHVNGLGVNDSPFMERQADKISSMALSYNGGFKMDDDGTTGMNGKTIQCRTEITYGSAKKISYYYGDEFREDTVGTEADAWLDPSDPVKGSKVGTKTGIYEDYGLVQGHLLNADLGGRAINQNLFPLTYEANKNHSGIEGEVKTLYRKLSPFQYISYHIRACLSKDRFENRNEYINNSNIFCSIKIEKDGQEYTLANEFPIENYDSGSLIVPGTNGSENRLENANKTQGFTDAYGYSRINYNNPIQIKYWHCGIEYMDMVSGGMEAYLNPMSIDILKGTGVAEKTGIYERYKLVQGHMLNAELGGRAVNQNLFPISVELNNHHAGIENQVKKLYTDFAISRNYGGRNFIFYSVMPVLEKREFKSKVDFLQHTRIHCLLDTPDGQRRSIVLDNPPPSTNRVRLPSAVSGEKGGRDFAGNVKQWIMNILSKYPDKASQCNYIYWYFFRNKFEDFTCTGASAGQVIERLKNYTFLMADGSGYVADTTTDAGIMCEFMREQYFTSLAELYSMNDDDLVTLLTQNRISGDNIAEKFPA